MQITIKQISNYNPGLIGKYVEKEVEESNYYPICVKVDEQCNHANTDYEEVALSHDPAETEMAETCNGCGAIYNHLNEEWLR